MSRGPNEAFAPESKYYISRDSLVSFNAGTSCIRYRKMNGNRVARISRRYTKLQRGSDDTCAYIHMWALYTFHDFLPLLLRVVQCNLAKLPISTFYPIPSLFRSHFFSRFFITFLELRTSATLFARRLIVSRVLAISVQEWAFHWHQNLLACVRSSALQDESEDSLVLNKFITFVNKTYASLYGNFMTEAYANERRGR